MNDYHHCHNHWNHYYPLTKQDLSCQIDNVCLNQVNSNPYGLMNFPYREIIIQCQSKQELTNGGSEVLFFSIIEGLLTIKMANK